MDNPKTIGMLFMVFVAILIGIVILYAIKPFFQRFIGTKASLEKSEETNKLLKEQNELLKKLVDEQKE